MKRKHLIINHRNAALLALALATCSALAVDGTWILNGSDNWSNNTTAWAGNAIADGPGAIATFDTVTFSSNRNITLNTARTIGTLKLGNSPSNRSFNLVTSNSSILTLDNGGNNAQITFRDGGANANLAVAVALNSNLLITNNDDGGDKGFFFTGTGGISSTNGHLTITNTSHASSRTKFNSVVSDGTAGNSISYNQTGGWSEFTASNTFSGTTTNGGGLLHINIGTALQNSALNTTGSVMGSATQGIRIVGAGVTTLTLGGLIGDKNMNQTGTGVFSSTSGNYSQITALTLNPGTGKSHTYDGAIENGAVGMTLTKTGDGIQTLGGTSTYTGDTLVSAGTLFVNGSLSSSTNDVSVTGTATLGGYGAIAGTLSLGGNSFLNVFLDDPLAVAGTVTFGSGFGIDNLTGIAWDSVALGGHTILTGSSQNFSVANLDNWGSANAVTVGSLGRKAYFDNGSLQVVVSAIPEPASVLSTMGLLASGLLIRRRKLAAEAG